MAHQVLGAEVSTGRGLGLSIDAQTEVGGRSNTVTLLDSNGGIRSVFIKQDFDMFLALPHDVRIDFGFVRSKHARTHDVPPTLASDTETKRHESCAGTTSTEAIAHLAPPRD